MFGTKLYSIPKTSKYPFSQIQRLEVAPCTIHLKGFLSKQTNEAKGLLILHVVAQTHLRVLKWAQKMQVDSFVLQSTPANFSLLRTFLHARLES